MSARGSVTGWLHKLKEGDHAAAQALWERYFHRLVGLARRRLHGRPCRAADEEDVALSAFDSFCRAAGENRFARLLDRNDLWQLLVMLTARKALRASKHERRQKRGGGRVFSATDLAAAAGADGEDELARVIGPEPSPDFAAQVAEECGRLLGILKEEALRRIALWKMEGYTTEEIAGRLGCAPRTVERKLRRVRSLWSDEVAS